MVCVWWCDRASVGAPPTMARRSVPAAPRNRHDEPVRRPGLPWPPRSGSLVAFATLRLGGRGGAPAPPCARSSVRGSWTRRVGSRSTRVVTSSWPTPGTAGWSWCRPMLGRSTGCTCDRGSSRRSPVPRARAQPHRGTRAAWRSTAGAISSSPKRQRNGCRSCGPGPATAVTVAGTGRAGFNGDGLVASAARARPADRGRGRRRRGPLHCRHRQLQGPGGPGPERHPLRAGDDGRPHLHRGGTGVCGTTGQGGPVVRGRSCWNPVAVTIDGAGDLLVADSGDQSVLLAPAHAGTFYGTTIDAGDIGVVVGGTGSYGPYLSDGLPATGPAAELNDPRGLAVGPTGALFVTDGFMHVLRVVPATSGMLLGRTMTGGDLYTAAGALPVKTAAGLGDGTRWVLTHMGTPSGVVVSPSGAVYYADAGLDTVRVDRDGDHVSRFGRRTFLASSAGVAAGATVAGATPPRRLRRRSGRRGRSDAATRADAPGGPARHRCAPAGSRRTARSTPSASIPTTARSPGRCRPRGRPVMQTAYRIVVRRTDPGPRRDRVGQRSGRLGPAGLRRLRRSSARRRRRLPVDRPAEGVCRAVGAGVGAGAVHHGLRPADWQAQWLRPAGASQQPDRFTYLRTEIAPPAGTVRRATAFVSAAHTYRLFVNGAAARCLAQLLLPRRAVRPGRRPDRRRDRGASQRRRRAAPLVRGGQGQARVGTGAARPALAVVRRRSPRRVRVRRHLARAPGRVAALAAAQLRRLRLRRMGGRSGPPERVGGSRLRRRRVVAR